MAQLYLYTNSAGSFVLNQGSYVIDKVMFKDNDIIKNSETLSKGMFTETEKALMKKHAKGQFTVIGFKSEKIDGVRNEPGLGIAASLINEMRDEIKHADTVITKHRIRNSVNEDIFIIQAVNHIKELEKVTNTMAKRLREWYSYYAPEFSESISDHEKFAEIVVRKPKEKLLQELKIKKDNAMGADIKKKDLDPIIELAKELNQMYKLKEKQKRYLEKLMNDYAPNISAIAGPIIGAKLLAQAGSLKRLSEFPASTVQVLGAEEAFFRHMTTGAKPPKYGYIHEHPFIAQADKASKGKIARALADKTSIAARVDYFRGEFCGDKLRKQVEAKLNSSRPRKEQADGRRKDNRIPKPSRTRR